MTTLRSWTIIFLLFLYLGWQQQNLALQWGSILFLVLIYLAYFYSKLTLLGLEIDLSLSRRRIMAGEEVDFIITIENLKLLPILGLEIICGFSPGLELESGRFLRQDAAGQKLFEDTFHLNWLQRVKRKYALQLNKRGRYTISRSLLRSNDYFSLFSKEKELDKTLELFVYPRLYPIKTDIIAEIKAGGTRFSQGWILVDKNNRVGVRDYQPQDSWKNINWKISARHQGLKSDIYHPSLEVNVDLLLDVRTTKYFWGGYAADKLEKAINITASLARKLLKNDLATGLLSNGIGSSEQGFYLPADNNPRQLERILTELACLRPIYRKDISDYSGSLSNNSQKIIITGFISPQELEKIRANLKGKIKLVLVGEERELPPAINEIPGLKIYQGRLSQVRGEESYELVQI